MFGTNQIVGRAYFKNAENSLLVTSIFASLQGEGPFCGRPAIFLRLSKCNLACPWCDAFFDYGDWFTIDNLVNEIYKRVPGDGVRGRFGLVVTGGEPSLQSNLVLLLEKLNFSPWEFLQIESNGILVLENLPNYVTLVVSPKCNDNKGVAERYLKPNPQMLTRADCLKFVMCADKDSPYNSIPDWALDWHKDTKRHIYLSPMNIYNKLPEKIERLRQLKEIPGIEARSTVYEVASFWEPGLLDMAANQRNHEYTARYAIDHGLYLSIQMHLLASLA